MEQTSMTALICAFSRAYHSEHKKVKVYDDHVAKALLTDAIYQQVSNSLLEGIQFFLPGFEGTKEDALRCIVDQQLSPLPLGRAAFAEQSLQRAAFVGIRQYVILGAGYDTFAYRQPAWAKHLSIFELDHPNTAQAKQRHLKDASIPIPKNLSFVATDLTQESWPCSLREQEGFSSKSRSFCSLLGLVYYLSKEAFSTLLVSLSPLLPPGSSLVFDYPEERYYTEGAGGHTQKLAILAGAANEPMLASYSYAEMEALLSKHGFLIYEHLTPTDMTQQYFASYNKANPTQAMTALDHVNYCLAVKQEV